ncbi:hypothetical protein H5T52_02745 [Candidatus Bipolaricaulota bacterium]|nr:hypothetical protein [Candidatus Bipolaricaulota bacterium]
MMWSRELDEEIREAFAREIEAAGPRLEGLVGRVMARLAARSARPSVWQRIMEGFTWPGWAWVGGVTLALALGFLLGRLMTPSSTPLSAYAQAGTLFAVVDPEAQSVAVVGDFSAWQPIPLSDPDGDGIWTVVLELPPGRYEYAYVVDGNWIGQDPQADEYVRSFGEYSSVRYVGTGGGV